MTKPQEKFLAECAVSPQGASASYKPAETLWLGGLLKRVGGHYDYFRFSITPEGRKVLKQIQAKQQKKRADCKAWPKCACIARGNGKDCANHNG